MLLPIGAHTLSPQPDLAAGDFSSWVTEMQAAIRSEGEANVPCDGCTACCTSSQFIHIEPHETDALARIPKALLFPAPRMPRGHVLMGYDERGHCPMLIDNQCSIYEHRPQTCRTYDCRIFPAAGVMIEDDDLDKVLIAERARRWKFTLSTEADKLQHEAVKAAATYLQEHLPELPAGATPNTTTQLAVLAFDIHDVFLQHNGRELGPEIEDVRAEVLRCLSRSKV
jgi:uncharacterized protein